MKAFLIFFYPNNTTGSYSISINFTLHFLFFKIPPYLLNNRINAHI